MRPPAGEFALIDTFVERLGGRRPPDGVQLGSGDDAAVTAPESWPVVTVDTLVEDVHWNPAWSRPEDVGFKLLSCNLSDVTAMGATAGPFLLALSLGADADSAWCDAFIDGLIASRHSHGLDAQVVVPIGGDVTRSPGPTVLSLVLFGRPLRSGRVFRRSHARVGHQLWVTGPLGSAEAGLRLLAAGWEEGGDPRLRPLVTAHRRPRARTDLVTALADLPSLGAVIDVSDGLAGDLRHVLRASSVGAEVWLADIPTDPLLDQLPESLAAHRQKLVLGGGEDFELLLTAAADVSERLEALGCRRVGRIVEGQALVYYDANGRPLDIDVSGYSHM